MTELMKASHQWSSRPDDERYTSLVDMRDHFKRTREHSEQMVVSTKQVEAEPDGSDRKALTVAINNKVIVAPTHWSFGQLCGLAKGQGETAAPSGYLRSLPAPLAADCINYGLRFKREAEEIGVLLNHNDSSLQAATGPRYGRIWNADVSEMLVREFGDGVNGTWKVPGEFGKRVAVTKANTTLYAGDRDMFVFLADEENRIELPGRRNGEKGTLARGFFVWNSEVGSTTFGVGTFFFDYVCCNRIVWGAEGYQEIRIRHSITAPDKFIHEITPALERYRQASDKGVLAAIEDARKQKLDDDLDDFLAKRFGSRMVAPLKTIHELEEGRPIENRWDVVTAATAKARTIKWQDQRVALERQAGELLKAA